MIYRDADHCYVDGLFRIRTWATVYDQVRREKPGLFNALNLVSLKVGRPSPLEAPIECGHLESCEAFLQAWSSWYSGIDESVVPATDLQNKAEKKGLSLPDAFAGLLVFDMLCVAAVRHVFPESTFARVADVARALPYTTLTQKHAAAAEYFDSCGAVIAFVQEARGIEEHPAIVEAYLPLFTGKDPYWAQNRMHM